MENFQLEFDKELMKELFGIDDEVTEEFPKSNIIGYQLFLDDIRTPSWIYTWTSSLYEEFKNDNEWFTVKTFDEAVALVEQEGCPTYISFDHDLGGSKSGMDFAKWIVEKALDDPNFIPEGFQYYVHSANGVGAANIWGLLNNFFDKGR